MTTEDLDLIAEVIVKTVQAREAVLLTRIAELAARQAVPGPAGPPGPPGQDGARGTDGDPGQAGAAGERGADGAPGPTGEPGERGRPGQNGIDGAGIVAAVHTAEGALLLTLSDGRALDCGRVRGADGAPGKAGDPGKDGAPGKDGQDGNVEGLGFEFDGERTLNLSYPDGSPVKSGCIYFSGLPIYRKVYQDGRTYEAGDVVTFRGCLWYAKSTTTTRPDEHGPGADAWILSVKRGADGRPGLKGTDGAPGKDGDQGRPGRDLR